MPLLDLFHAGAEPLVLWSSFHAAWVPMITGWLNRHLPARYRARSTAHLGRSVAADVVEYERGDLAAGAGDPGSSNGVALATWAPPLATGAFPLVFSDEFQVRVLDALDGASVVAVIELVSPANKDRETSRNGFIGKCAAYLQRGIGVLVVDVVTNRNAQLTAGLLEFLGQDPEELSIEPTELHAAAYRPVRQDENATLEYWLQPLQVGEVLPTMPLCLRNGEIYPVDLEETFQQASEIEGY